MEWRELLTSPGWGRLLKSFRNIRGNFKLTALEPGSSMDQLIKNNAAAAQAVAFEKASQIPSLYIEDLEIEIKDLRTRLATDNEQGDYDADFRAEI